MDINISRVTTVERIKERRYIYYIQIHTYLDGMPQIRNS